jgi:hypothetical protein
MTHSLHREGSVESLKGDFCLLAYCTRGVNDEGASEKILQVIKILQKNGLANLGIPTVSYSTQGGLTVNDIATMIVKQKIPRLWCCVPGRSNITKVLRELKERDLGLSITVSGLIDDIMEISKELDIHPHTISLSAGIHGDKKRLPPKEILEVTTMCGHGMISKKLVANMAEEVKEGKTSTHKASKKLAKPCSCGIFNTARAEELIRRMVNSE